MAQYGYNNITPVGGSDNIVVAGRVISTTQSTGGTDLATRNDVVSLANTQIASSAGSFGYRNKLINAGFRTWQRGTSFTASGYWADRWQGTIGGGATITQGSHTLGTEDVTNGSPYYLQHARTVAAVADNVVLEQRIESIRTLAGKSVTVQIRCKAGAAQTFYVDLAQIFGTGGTPSATVAQTAQAISVTTAWTTFTLHFTLPGISGTLGSNGDDALSVRIWEKTTYGTFTLQVAYVQVEEGTNATEFEIRPYGTDTHLCKRYYQVIGKDTGWGFSGYSAAAASFIVAASLPVEMRATPTATKYGTWTVSATTTQPTVSATNSKEYTITVVNSSTATTSFATAGSTTYLDFAAEI